MTTLATWKTPLLALVLALAATPARANEFDGVDGPNVRFMKGEDGSKSLFIRSPDHRILTKSTRSPNGVLTMVTRYTMDASQNPIGCKIRDGQGTEMFKVSYGYDQNTGQLMAELMFDSRVKRIDPRSGKEMPVQRVAYLYDANGERSAPIVFNLLPGKTFEEVFGVKSSALDRNPFKEKP